MIPAPLLVVARVARALEEAGVAYFVGGSLASSRYGIPRATQDVDLVADLQRRHVLPLVRALKDEFYIDAGTVREAIRRRSSFNVIDMSAAYKVDVFLVRSDPWDQQELARRRAEKIGPAPDAPTLYFCTPEDIVLHKLEWYRQGGGVSDRQWGDVVGVLKVRAAELDASYLRQWAHDLGLTDLLEHALREAAVTL